MKELGREKGDGERGWVREGEIEEEREGEVERERGKKKNFFFFLSWT
jgi:hypothetical protein